MHLQPDAREFDLVQQMTEHGFHIRGQTTLRGDQTITTFVAPAPEWKGTVTFHSPTVSNKHPSHDVYIDVATPSDIKITAASLCHGDVRDAFYAFKKKVFGA